MPTARSEQRVGEQVFRASPAPAFRSAFLPARRKAKPSELAIYGRGRRRGAIAGFAIGYLVGISMGGTGGVLFGLLLAWGRS